MNKQCGWQLCDNPAQFVRDTPWGDLDVCGLHVEAPLYDVREGIRVSGIKFVRRHDSDGNECTCAPDQPVTGVGGPSTKLYAPRDPSTLEPYYSRHVAAMTSEGLHAKSLIAAELAFRDLVAAQLIAALEDAVAFLEMQDCEVGDDVWLWLHQANELLKVVAPEKYTVQP